MGGDIAGFGPGESDNTLAVVEIANPKLDGEDLVHDDTLIDGTLPASGEAASLSIDWIGVGARGVGVL